MILFTKIASVSSAVSHIITMIINVAPTDDDINKYAEVYGFMTFIMYKLIGSLIVPPGLFCIAIVLCALTALREPRKKVLSASLLCLATLLWLMSTPLGTALITGPLEDMYRRSLPPGGGPYSVLVLGGGLAYDGGNTVQPGRYTFERIYCAVSLVKKYGGTLILSGGNTYGAGGISEAEAMKDCARKLGWDGRIILEEKSRTTKENILMAADILKAENIKNIVVVTNAFHIPRTMYYASKIIPAGSVYPYASGRIADPLFKGFYQLLPEGTYFSYSCIGIKEWIGAAAARIF